MTNDSKLFGILSLLTVVCIGGFITLVIFSERRAQREVESAIASLAPGTPFSAAIQRLGQPVKIYTTEEEIISWVEHIGAHVEPRVATNSALHTFVHRGPPCRYILVYTDRESQRVIHADWCPM